MPISLKHLRECALVVLEKTILDLFPKAKLIDGQVTDYGFCYHVAIGKDYFDKGTLKILEDHIFLDIQQGLEIKYVEMLRDNAIAYLRHHKQGLKAAFLEKSFSPGMMSFLQCGGLIEPSDYCGDQEVDIKSIKAFRLLDLCLVDSEFADDVYRISGTVFHDKNDLKLFLKQRAAYKENYHFDLATRLGLSYANSKGDRLWCSKGIRLVRILVESWEKECEELGIEHFKSSALNENELINDLLNFYDYRKNEETFAAAFEGMFLRDLPNVQRLGFWRSNYYFAERAFFIVDEMNLKNNLISSLQFIAKKGIMLCSESCWVLPKFREIPPKLKKDWGKALKTLINTLKECGFSYMIEEKPGFDFMGPKAYLTFPDIFGKNWKGPFVGLDLASLKGKAIISRSMFGSFERYIAYLLEWSKGNLPLAIAPEQVRLIARNETACTYAKKVQAKLVHHGFRVKIDSINDKLSARIHVAERERIPYIAVIGDREYEQQTVAVRALGSHENDRQLAVSAFILELLQGVYDINSGHILSPVAFLKQINVETDSD